MATSFLEPEEIEFKQAERILRFSWSDGHESLLDLDYLRGYCPCAMCQGHGGQWEYVPSQQVVLAAMEEVGNYAFNFLWQDGHQTGIYSFELLRRLCPCEECVTAAGPSHPFLRMPS